MQRWPRAASAIGRPSMASPRPGSNRGKAPKAAPHEEDGEPQTSTNSQSLGSTLRCPQTPTAVHPKTLHASSLGEGSHFTGDEDDPDEGRLP